MGRVIDYHDLARRIERQEAFVEYLRKQSPFCGQAFFGAQDYLRKLWREKHLFSWLMTTAER